jgi:beta-galactosidase
MSTGRIDTHTVPKALGPRERTLFDAGWLFHLGDVEAGQAPDLDARRWRRLDLPHDWSIEGPIAESNPAGAAGGFCPGGIGWYRKPFIAPAAWAGRKTAIEFDGVYWHSDVWINGHHLGHRPSGYVSLQYDLTDHLNIGGPNILAVRVDNSRQPNSRWYSGSGIYRHVWMNVTGRVHVARRSPCITAPQVSGGAATLAVNSTVCNETGSAAAVTLRSTVLDGSGRAVAAGESGQSIPAGGEHRFEQALTVAGPALWSPDAPNLYTLRGEVLCEGKLIDAVDTTVGIRGVVFDADRGLLLNGRPAGRHPPDERPPNHRRRRTRRRPRDRRDRRRRRKPRPARRQPRALQCLRPRPDHRRRQRRPDRSRADKGGQPQGVPRHVPCHRPILRPGRDNPNRRVIGRPARR